MSQILISITVLVFSCAAFAGPIEWGGLYRFEANSIKNPQLKTSANKSKDFSTSHLILRPRIVAADGLYINGQIHMLVSDAPGGQLGAVWGNGNFDNSSQMGKVRTSEMYASWVHDFSTLLVGRAPLQFGLGMTYNAGKGPFDHYLEVHDIVGYKITLGNFFIFPMIGKVQEGDIGDYDDLSEIMIQLQYENFEKETAMGFMYRNVRGGESANTSFDRGQNLKYMNIFYRRAWTEDKVGFEIGNVTGEYGNSTEGEATAYGVAIEYDHKSQGSNWSYGFKTGWATGDDSTSANEDEAFFFDKNYDVAYLLFNHSMGQAEMFEGAYGTSYIPSGTDTTFDSTDEADTDTISNVSYLAPYFRYQWGDNWYIRGSIITGWVDAPENSGLSIKGKKDLGYEWDLSLVYQPNERFTWDNTIAYMMTGDAFEFDNTYSINDGYGLFSRAAISF